MDWLKDKKNQPYVAGAAALVIVLVLVFVLRPMIFGGSSSSTPAATDPSAMGTAPGDASSGAPPMPGAPTPPGMAPDP
ncbi:hypothetical protein LLG39_15080, partial [bacterium]|nr:hypothetical protein [bacterium]